jgi:hypothetical protein
MEVPDAETGNDAHGAHARLRRVAILLGVSSASAERRAKAFTIRSSLDGKTVLPHRIRWVAYPSAGVLFPV